MRKFLHSIFLVAALLIVACGGEQKKYSPITQELITIVEQNPDIRRMLEQSIAQAKQIVPDKKYNPAQSIEEYYDFVEWSTKCMPWNVWEHGHVDLYDKIDQSLIYAYFICDQPLVELEGNGKYYNSLQYVEPYRSWLIKYAKTWGEFLSTPQSWNAEYYEEAAKDPRFGLTKGWYEDSSKWNSFNDFFCRYLSSPDVRPIAEPDNHLVVASAADSKPQGVWAIDDSSMLVQKEGVLLKSKYFNSIETLLGEKSQYGKAFAGGTLTHSFLDVNDYHRYHFPVGGTIKEIGLIAGDDAAGGITVWDSVSKRYVLKCDVPGWQMIETRGWVVVDNPELGLVAMLPIGMSQVSSVNFEKNLNVGDVVNKGDMLGYFLFGGSDFVILLQKGNDFTLAVEPFSHIYMGEHLGTINKN